MLNASGSNGYELIAFVSRLSVLKVCEWFGSDVADSRGYFSDGYARERLENF